MRVGSPNDASIEELGDVGMIHERQGLALGLEPGDDFAGVHAGLDDLERDLAVNRLGLLGQKDPAKRALADFLKQLVASNDGARPLADGLFFRRHDRLFEEIARPLVGPQEPLFFGAEQRVALTGGVMVGGTRLRRVFAGGFGQNFFQSFVFDAHGHRVPYTGLRQNGVICLQDSGGRTWSIDYKCRLFQTTLLNIVGTELGISNETGKLHNLKAGTVPCFLHCNGGVDWTERELKLLRMAA